MAETTSGLWYPGEGWEEKGPRAVPSANPFGPESDPPPEPGADDLIDELRRDLDDYGTIPE